MSVKKRNKKTLSLVILNYNGTHLLKEYFDSVYRQTIIPDEIIMVDNNSTDDSVAFVKKNYPHVIIAYHHSNVGTAQGSNIGFQYTTGDYIIFQSNDIILDAHCIEYLIQTIESDKTIGICTSVLINEKTYKKTKRQIIDNAGGVMDVYGFCMQKYYETDIRYIPQQGEIFFSYGGSFIVRKDVFEKAGGFDPRYFTLHDDVDLSWRIRLIGYRIVYNKKSFVFHKMSATLGSLFTRPIKRFWSARNNIRTVLKNYTAKDVYTKFPVYAALYSAETMYFLLRGRIWLFLANVSAIFWNLFLLPETLFLRFKIQRLRKKNNIEDLLIPHSLKLKMFKEFKKAI